MQHDNVSDRTEQCTATFVAIQSYLIKMTTLNTVAGNSYVNDSR